MAGDSSDQPKPPDTETPRVLVIHEDVQTARLIRETLESFMDVVVESSPNPEYAFELALGRPYSLFIFQFDMERLRGVLLYELIAKAYPHAHGDKAGPPGVVFTEAKTTGAGSIGDDWQHDARVKGILHEPIAIDRLLEVVKGILTPRDSARSRTGTEAISDALTRDRSSGDETAPRRRSSGAEPLSFLDKAASSGATGVKICGLTTDGESRAIIDMGVDALGFNFWPDSKRYFGIPEVHPWLKELAGSTCRIGVFVNASRDQIVRYFQEGWIDAAQLHGDESWEFCSELSDEGIPFIKAVGVKDEDSLKELRSYATPYLLLDAHAPVERGGTGRTFEWGLARDACVDYPELRIILSGGLTPDNVAEAVRAVEPAGVDTASGVEKSPGFKDLAKVEAFLRGVW